MPFLFAFRCTLPSHCLCGSSQTTLTLLLNFGLDVADAWPQLSSVVALGYGQSYHSWKEPHPSLEQQMSWAAFQSAAVPARLWLRASCATLVLVQSADVNTRHPLPLLPPPR
ncbi:hypothetical protein ISCGN_015810 [Ixodes scapularis]